MPTTRTDRSRTTSPHYDSNRDIRHPPRNVTSYTIDSPPTSSDTSGSSDAQASDDQSDDVPEETPAVEFEWFGKTHALPIVNGADELRRNIWKRDMIEDIVKENLVPTMLGLVRLDKTAVRLARGVDLSDWEYATFCRTANDSICQEALHHRNNTFCHIYTFIQSALATPHIMHILISNLYKLSKSAPEVRTKTLSRFYEVTLWLLIEWLCGPFLTVERDESVLSRRDNRAFNVLMAYMRTYADRILETTSTALPRRGQRSEDKDNAAQSALIASGQTLPLLVVLSVALADIENDRVAQFCIVSRTTLVEAFTENLLLWLHIYRKGAERRHGAWAAENESQVASTSRGDSPVVGRGLLPSAMPCP